MLHLEAYWSYASANITRVDYDPSVGSPRAMPLRSADRIPFPLAYALSTSGTPAEAESCSILGLWKNFLKVFGVITILFRVLQMLCYHPILLRPLRRLILTQLSNRLVFLFYLTLGDEPFVYLRYSKLYVHKGL